MYESVEKYRGCLIYKNINKNFGTYYYSVVNPKKSPKDKPDKNCHCHSNTYEIAKKVVDCFWNLTNYRCSHRHTREIKNKALRLMDVYVKAR